MHSGIHTDSHTWLHDDPCVWGWVCGWVGAWKQFTCESRSGGAAFEIPFLCLGLFLNGSHAVLPDLVLMSLFCTPGQMCDGCEMYLSCVVV